MASEVEASQSAPQVFATFELLEMILIYSMSPEDDWPQYTYLEGQRIRALFRLQRVNTTFRDVINSSKILGVALFRRYEDADGKDDKAQYGVVGEDGYVLEDPKLHINPLLLNLYDFTNTYYTTFQLAYCDKEEMWVADRNLQGTVIADGMPKGASRSGSWRKLLIANKQLCWPTHVRVYLAKGTQVCCWYSVRLKEDATLGTLADTVAKIVTKALVHEHNLRKKRIDTMTRYR